MAKEDRLSRESKPAGTIALIYAPSENRGSSAGDNEAIGSQSARIGTSSRRVIIERPPLPSLPAPFPHISHDPGWPLDRPGIVP